MPVFTSIGPDTRVTGPGQQADGSIAVLVDGRLVIAWTEHSTTFGTDPDLSVRAAIHDPDGTVRVASFQVNTLTAGGQVDPSVVALPGGGFAIYWMSTSTEIRGRVFAADGAPLGEDFAVAGGDVRYTEFATTALAGGRVALTWGEWGPDGASDVRVVLLEAAAGPVIADRVVSAAGNSTQINPAIAPLAGGGFVVTWGQGGDAALTPEENADNRGIRGQIHDASGTPLGNAFVVHAGSSGYSAVNLPSGVAQLADGRIVVVFDNDPGEGTGQDVLARFFAADGTALGPALAVNSTTALAQRNPQVAALPDGGFVIAYDDDSDWIAGTGVQGNIRARAFDADGTPRGNDFLIHQSVAGWQVTSGLAVAPDGRLHAAWFTNQGLDVMFQTYLRTLRGTEGNDTLAAGNMPAALLGEAGDDLLRGSPGDDLLSGGPGNDTLNGGAGRDTAVFAVSSQAVRVDGPPDLLTVESAEGTDTLHDIEAFRFTDRTLGLAEMLALRDERITGTGGNDTLRGGYGDDTIHGGFGNDNIGGGPGNDVIYGDAGNNLIWGGDGDDLIYGGTGHDSISGGTGNDTIHGGAGNDTIYGATFQNTGTGSNRLFGEDGNDLIFAGHGGDFIGGGAGNDKIFGGAGNDAIWGGLGNDTVDGGLGNDTIYGGGNGTNRLLGNDGNDLIFAGDGGDFIGGGAGNDTIRGGAGADTIYGGLGNDDLAGGTGNDVIFGSAGNNVIWGGAGNDTIHSGLGRDVMNGGPGADVFVFASAQHIGIGAARDRIADFTPGVDRIDLSALNTQFNGAAGFMGGGQASFYHFAAGGLLIGDQTGNGVADWVIETPGVAGFGAGDFIL